MFYLNINNGKQKYENVQPQGLILLYKVNISDIEAGVLSGHTRQLPGC